MRGAIALFSVAALALAAPRGAVAAESPPELQLVYRLPEAGPEPGLPYRPPAADDPEAALALELLYRPPAAEPGQGAPLRHEERALIEFGTFLIFNNLRYWATSAFPEDDQFKLTWQDQKTKLLKAEGIRFDSNAFQTNWTHAYAGALYYEIGRANNVGVMESFLLAAFSSLYWETVVEWKEVLSVNDTIMTDFGALSIGEPWYQLSRYLLTRPSTVANVLGFINPVLGLHAVLDPDSRPRPTDSQNLPDHGVFLTLGAATTDSRYASAAGNSLSLGLRSRLALAPGFTSPGTESRQDWEVLSSNFSLNVDLDGGTAREFDASSGAVFYGRLERRVAEDLRGSASILGLGSAFTLFVKEPVTDYDAGQVKVGIDNLDLEEPRDFRDKYAIMHLFGPVYEGYWRGSTATVAWGLEAYPDFGLINAYALNTYSVGHEVDGTKTTMLYSGYYYGYGATATARLEASAGLFSFGATGSAHYHASIEGLDRFQDDLTNDVHASDTWLQIGTRLGVCIPRTPLSVEATARWSSRHGTVGEAHAKGTESRYSLGLTYRL